MNRLLLLNNGIGDFFQYARFIGSIRGRCRTLTLAVQDELRVLATRLPEVHRVVGLDSMRLSTEFDSADAFCELNENAARPLGRGYGSPSRVDVVDALPALGEGHHVGLRWRANLRHPTGRSRSIEPVLFEPLRDLAPGSTFHVLQPRSEEADAPAWMIRHGLRSIDQTLALVAALDSVVTVDTCTAHIGGTLGRPTHVIVRDPTNNEQLARDSEALWGRGASTPWYPTVRLHRGPADAAVREIGDALSQAGTSRPPQTLADRGSMDNVRPCQGPMSVRQLASLLPPSRK